MKIMEMKLKVYCLEDIPQNEALQEISKLIDSSLIEGGQVELHYQNTFKPYSFCNLYPLESYKIYLKGNIYTVMIRCIEGKIAKTLASKLSNQYTRTLKALTIESKMIPYKYLDRIYSITPVVIKTPEGYWRDHYNIEFFERRIRENLIKKYNYFNDLKIEEDFELFKTITVDNKKPIAVKYKDIVLLGDKVTLEIDDNEQAQKLAYMAIAVGLGELSARGNGAVNFRYL